MRKPRPDLVWTDFWPLINKVIHKKREQLGQLRFAAWVSSSTTCLLRIAQINRIIKLTLRSSLKFLKLVKSTAGGIDEKFEP